MSEEYSRIQWFPGHMAKAKRKIEESLPKVDIVAEIADARIPESSRNPLIDKIISNKPRILLLSKADLADPKETAKWISYYKKKGITAISIDSKSGRNINRFLPAVTEILKDKIAAWQNRGMIGRTIKIMIVGIPNVGKSAFINFLCRGGGKGRADVQDRPGVTRQNRWFSVGKGFDLLDTPGVLWHKFEDKRAAELLSFTGAVNDDVLDTEFLAGKLLALLAEEYPESLLERYKITKEETMEKEPHELLELVGRKRGMLVSGGEINTQRAADTVLDEFRSAKIGKITLERAE